MCAPEGSLGQTQVPKSSHVFALGWWHELPIKATKHSTRPVSQAELKYLGGFFDGDGCVSARSCTLDWRLSICQSQNSADILMAFYKTFGGGIYHQMAGTGLANAALMWIASGSAAGDARIAAAHLAEVSFLKREQLLLAAHWPKCKDMRAGALTKLKMYKQKPETREFAISWPYLAGCFDAEGCIVVPPKEVAVRLDISQNHKELLESIAAFLREQVPSIALGIHRNGARGFVLSTHSTSHSIFILRRLVASGLRVKKRHAEVAVAVKNSENASIREGL
eukprot:TRINITY_DN14220_c0_g2_i1.p1 TRINITY_DN14220_c0_g2~~TRINITY_DN14220_c0_g2_i1.p1  ORF type:complete len:280 (-),score=33.33 TRINITY_DN14220_c0_g2_i1:25-864(-)